MRTPDACEDFPLIDGRPLVVVEAPSNLGLKPPSPGREPGVCRLPEALTEAGLPERVPAFWGGRIAPPRYSGSVDPATGVRNGPEVAAYARALAPAVEAALVRGFPMVLGGDCSILLGCLLAERRRAGAGLVFLDGHDDFSLPETSASRGAAAMELALASGRGPATLSNLDGLAPLVRDEDVLVVGAREKSQGIPFRSLEVNDLRHSHRAIAPALAALPSRRFWIHLDVDVLDPATMPAVDSPEPGGIEPEELSAVLRFLLESGRADGLDVTILDPDRDPDGTSARLLVSLLAGVFGPATGCRR
jgi:arginase